MVAIIVMACVIIGVVLASGLRQSGPGYRRRAVMTGNEVEFYGRLARAVPGMHVCPQVAMHALIEATAANSNARLIDFRRISQKVVDYAVFDDKWRLVVVVELDDRTHDRHKDAARDAYLASAGVPTLRYQSKSKPLAAQIAVDVAETAKVAPAQQLAGRPHVAQK